jgi:hypothetical protein
MTGITPAAGRRELAAPDGRLGETAPTASSPPGVPATNVPKNHLWPTPAAARRQPQPPTAGSGGHGPAAKTEPIIVAPMHGVETDDVVNVDLIVAAALRSAAHPGISGQRRARVSELAHRLAQRTHAAFAPLALDAARLRAQVLDEQGDHAQAARLWGRLISLYQLAHRPDAEQHARLAHAVDLHRTGQCGEAHNQITTAWTCAPQPGHHQPPAATVQQIYLAMLTACGQDSGAVLADAPAITATDTAEQAPTSPAGDAEPDRTDWLAGVEPPDVHRRRCAFHAYAQSKARP